MGLADYLRAVRKNWWLVLAAVLVAIGTAGLVTIGTSAQYATMMTFFVSTPNRGIGEALQGSTLSQQRVKSYADLLTGDRLAKTIDERHQLGLTVEDIQARIQARAIPDTVLLRVTVTDGDPDRCERLAGAIATELAGLVERIEQSGHGEDASVSVSLVDGPTLDPTPVAPRPARNLLIGLLLGLLAGCVGAVVRDTMDTTVKTPEALAGATGAPVLGVVPLDVTAGTAPLAGGGQVNSARAEAFRQIRTNLRFVGVDRPVRTIAVTSAHRDEGKSTTSCNLAISLASAGEKVLLVEGDLRCPRLGDYLGLEGAIGLTNVLTGQAQLDSVIQRWGSGLHVLLAGPLPPNPSELLGSGAMSELLAALTVRFDRIIIDTPPLLPVTDGAVIAAQTDGVVLIARSAKTSVDHIRRASESLRAVGAQVVGCVLNMHRACRDENSYYPYQDAVPSRTASRGRGTGRRAVPAYRHSAIDERPASSVRHPADVRSA